MADDGVEAPGRRSAVHGCKGFGGFGAAVAPSRLQGKSPQTARPLCYPPLAQRAALDERSAVFVNLLNCTAIRGGEEGEYGDSGPRLGFRKKEGAAAMRNSAREGGAHKRITAPLALCS